MIDLEKLDAAATHAQVHGYLLKWDGSEIRQLVDRIAKLEKDAGRYRFLCEKYDVSLLTTFFGNGCINKKIDDVNRAIDTAMEAKHE